MISQKCPKCQSKRIRKGYRPTSIFSKIFFRFQLLCDNCNWEFTGFALPFFKSSQKSRRKKVSAANLTNISSVEAVWETQKESQSNDFGKNPARIKRKIRIRM